MPLWRLHATNCFGASQPVVMPDVSASPLPLFYVTSGVAAWIYVYKYRKESCGVRQTMMKWAEKASESFECTAYLPQRF